MKKVLLEIFLYEFTEKIKVQIDINKISIQKRF